MDMLDQSKDLVMPVVGKTGVGKSKTTNTTIELLLKGRSKQIPSSGAANGSTLPYVVLYQRHEDNARVFLMDLPGIGAATIYAEGGAWVHDQMETLLKKFTGVIACAALVVNQVPTTEEMVCNSSTPRYLTN